MAEPDLVAVEATKKDYRALRHQPSGEGFDEDGKGLWRADQFTFALIRDGALRYVSTDTDQTAAAPATKGK